MEDAEEGETDHKLGRLLKSESGEGGGVEVGDGEGDTSPSSLGNIHLLFGITGTPAHVSIASFHCCSDPSSVPVLSMLVAFHFSDTSFHSSSHSLSAFSFLTGQLGVVCPGPKARHQVH